MRERHVVVGAGPVGRSTAGLLLADGHEVLVVSRSGEGPALGAARRVAADAGDADRLAAIARGASAIYNCVNPPYHKWPQLWPPVAEALLRAAERTGAVLATASNLYAYGPVSGPMTEGMPDAATGVKGRVRATMWADALAAHQSGRVRAVEVRGSDYLGYGVGQGGHVPRLVPRALHGKSVRVFGSPDQPHSWTDVADMARALTAVARAEQAWGRVWHAPSNPPRTQRETITDICRSVGTEPGPIRAYGAATLRAGSWVSATLRELEETRYQFDRPFLLDSSLIARELGVVPTPWADVCRRTAGAMVPAAGSPTVS